ncbi:hypothetical protein ACWD01_21960 [Streptomyces sp. NPDC002835]
MGGSRVHRLSHHTRPTALLSAVATFLGALFFCLGPGGAHEATASPAYESANESAGGSAGESAFGPLSATAYSCPYDDGGCGLRPVLGPAVLTAPPLDAPPPAGAAPASLGTDPDAAPPYHSGAQARAPDLHVLQVMRT